MNRFGDQSGNCRRFLLNTAGLLAVAVTAAFGLANAAASQAQPQAQDTPAFGPEFKYDVASIKPDKSDSSWVGFRARPAADEFIVKNVTLRGLFGMAYRRDNGKTPFRPEQILGTPNWFDSEKYDVDAKMDSAVAAEMEKLSPDQRTLARQHMLQVLLAERFNLTVHLETKELPVYNLVLAKNGPKLKEAKPGDTYPDGIKFADGSKGGANFIDMRPTSTGGMTIIGQGVPVEKLVGLLSPQLGRTVLDKTGLTGKYDFTLQFAPNDSQMQADAADGQAALGASDPSGSPFLFTAIQQQLGLKLESSKGPVEIIVIDHVEKPSEN